VNSQRLLHIFKIAGHRTRSGGPHPGSTSEVKEKMEPLVALLCARIPETFTSNALAATASSQ